MADITRASFLANLQAMHDDLPNLVGIPLHDVVIVELIDDNKVKIKHHTIPFMEKVIKIKKLFTNAYFIDAYKNYKIIKIRKDKISKILE